MKHITTRSITLAVSAAALVASAPTFAGETKGNGGAIDINGRSECVYSGLNDLDGDPRDPGFRTQNYGQLVGPADWIDPSDLDPRYDFRIPGFACNPNRGRDLKDF